MPQGAGRRPKPTAIKAAKGTLKYAKVNNPDEPRPALGIPDPPPGMTPEVQAMWDELAPCVAGMRVLTDHDRRALLLLCETEVEVLQLREDLRAEGRTWKSVNPDTGQEMIRPNPKFAQYADAAKRLNMLHCNFGLNPASRAKVKVADGPAKSSVDDFFTTGVPAAGSLARAPDDSFAHA